MGNLICCVGLILDYWLFNNQLMECCTLWEAKNGKSDLVIIISNMYNIISSYLRG